jgi:putative hemolysin
MGVSSRFISKQNLIDIFGIKPWFASILMQMMKISKLNRFHDSLQPYDSTVELFQKALNKLNINVQFDTAFLDELLGKPFITCSNHAFGVLDGIIFISCIGKKYPKYKINANVLLSNSIPENTIPVNSFNLKNKPKKTLGATKVSLEWIRKGNPIGLFPAGKVATRYKGSRDVTDRPWVISAIRLIRMAEVPVIPIFIEGTNSKWFHFLGRWIHPLFKTFRTFKEFFNKKNTTVTIKPGVIIYPEEYLNYETDQELCDFLREKVYEIQ